jgi:hypothetical protein
MKTHQCMLKPGCEILRRISTFKTNTRLHEAIAAALIENELVATTLHEQFAVPPFIAVQLAAILSEARRTPPEVCLACQQGKKAA